MSRVMLALHSSYTQAFNRRYRRAGHLFQGRYKAFLVEKDRYWHALLRYIHENPVKAAMVEHPRAICLVERSFLSVWPRAGLVRSRSRLVIAGTPAFGGR